MHISTRNKKGFTLVELLLVVTIIGILAGAVLLNFKGTSGDVKISRAKADIQTLETALNLFEMDTGDYPSNEAGLIALVEDPGVENWKGSYLSKKITKDPWSNPYIYQHPGDKGINYDLFSAGKDKQEGSEDDIGNWDEEEY